MRGKREIEEERNERWRGEGGEERRDTEREEVMERGDEERRGDKERRGDQSDWSWRCFSREPSGTRSSGPVFWRTRRAPWGLLTRGPSARTMRPEAAL